MTAFKLAASFILMVILLPVAIYYAASDWAELDEMERRGG